MRNPRRSNFLAWGIGLILATYMLPAAAQLGNANFASRLNSRVLAFNDLTFANATDNATVTVQLAGSTVQIGQSGTVTDTERSSLQSWSVTAGSGLALSNIVVPNAANNQVGQFTAQVVGTASQFFSYSFVYPAVSPSLGFGASTVVVNPNNGGFYTLEYQCCRSGLAMQGGTYTVDVVLPGNWSSQGGGIGQAKLNSPLTSGWVTTQNFIYNATNNTTLFEVVNNNYVSGTAPNVDIVLTGLPATGATAQMSNSNFTTRQNYRTLTFSDLTFANATETGMSTVTLSPATVAGTSGAFTNSQRPAELSFTMGSGPAVQIDNVVPPSAQNSYNSTFTATLGADTSQNDRYFTFTTVYGPATPAQYAQNPNYSTFVLNPNANGYNTLEFMCCGAGFVTQGGTYVEDVQIPGDWSLGSGVGQAQLLGINAAWAVTQNFVYNPQTNTTLFEATNNNYAAGSKPGIDILYTGYPSGTSSASSMLASPYAIRSQVTSNSIGESVGDQIQVGAYCITLGTSCSTVNAIDTAQGLSVSALNGATVLALSGANDAAYPNQRSRSIPYSPSLTTPWTLELFENQSSFSVGSATTPSLMGAGQVEFPTNVAIAPNPATGNVLPIFSWNEPASFVNANGAIRVQIWDPTYGGTRPYEIYISSVSNPSVAFQNGQSSYSFAVPTSFVTNGVNYPLQNGHTYALEIQSLVLRNPAGGIDNTNVLARSRAFFNFSPGSVPVSGGANVVLPTTGAPTTGSNGAPVYTFNVQGVQQGNVVFIDPSIATGYTFAVGANNPNFASVTLPVTSPPSNYVITNAVVTPPAMDLDSGHSPTSGVQYNFSSLGGLAGFQITGINPAAAIDGSNSAAFVSGLSFVSTGNFSGTMVPILQVPQATDTASTITAGQSDTVYIAPAGAGATYQWYQGLSGDTSKPLSGATNNSFTTPPLTATTSYWVAVTQNGSTVDSTTVTVNVTAGAPAGNPAASDAPLPLWALLSLAAGMVGIAARKLKPA